MTTEELLYPRYLVIDEYPNNFDYPLNMIIICDKVWNPGYMMHEITDCQGTRTKLSGYFDKYPVLFKKLQWYEERDKKDLPEYVKYDEAVLRVYKYITKGHEHPWVYFVPTEGRTGFTIGKEVATLYQSQPSTEEEFVKYKLTEKY